MQISCKESKSDGVCEALLIAQIKSGTKSRKKNEVAQKAGKKTTPK